MFRIFFVKIDKQLFIHLIISRRLLCFSRGKFHKTRRTFAILTQKSERAFAKHAPRITNDSFPIPSIVSPKFRTYSNEKSQALILWNKAKLRSRRTCRKMIGKAHFCRAFDTILSENIELDVQLRLKNSPRSTRVPFRALFFWFFRSWRKRGLLQSRRRCFWVLWNGR